MSRSLTPVVVVVAAAAVLGCHRSAVPGSTVEARRQGDATIIEEDVLRHAGGSILNILPSYVAGMQVRHNSGCPEITLRGKKSLVNSNDPVVYVDGTRSGNTCVLDSLVPSDVQRVEVYPMGITQRPGYRGNPNGLILVFMKTTDGA